MDQDFNRILALFEQINAVPRCSKDEGRIGRWLQQWASSRSLKVRTDYSGNMVVQVPASPGAEGSPVVIIQGHMDMVCEKTPESRHDFSRDAIRSRIEGDWLRAEETTLGADNGIALAYAMALAEGERLVHPPLELLFTVDEETGLNGVKTMDPDLVSGRILINLDSEEEGVFTIGCAGGMETAISLNVNPTPVAPDIGMFRIMVGGLLGGHSGIDIHKQRGNANLILARTLASTQQRTSARLVAMKGGTRHNAIPRDAEAHIALQLSEADRLMASVAEMEKAIRAEYASSEAALYIKVEPEGNPGPPEAISSTDTSSVIRLLLALPHGVAGMSPKLQGLVETSSNLAVAELKGDTVSILSSQRSAAASRLTEITDKVHAVAHLAGASVRNEGFYPPWQPDVEAPLLARAQNSYQGLFGKPPAIQVIHAGLECAIIGDRIPGMQMISFGPNIEGAHSPSERMHLPSVDKVWRFLVALLGDLAKD